MRIVKEHYERKNEIINATEMLFTTKGYAKTTINDILKEVGIAKGTFYHYFASKEEVMDAIVMKIIFEGVEKAKIIVDDSSLNTYQKIILIIQAQGPQEGNNRKKMTEDLHHIDNAQMHQKSLVETTKHLAPILAQVVEQGKKENIFKTEYPLEVIEFLLTSSQFLLDDGLFNLSAEQKQRRQQALMHFMEILLEAKIGSFENIELIFSEK